LREDELRAAMKEVESKGTWTIAAASNRGRDRCGACAGKRKKSPAFSRCGTTAPSMPTT
jgi:hypothetical protein